MRHNKEQINVCELSNQNNIESTYKEIEEYVATDEVFEAFIDADDDKSINNCDEDDSQIWEYRVSNISYIRIKSLNFVMIIALIEALFYYEI